MKHTLIACAAVFASQQHTLAADWIGGIGDWTNPENWSNGVVPDRDDTVSIFNGGTAILDHQVLEVGAATFGTLSPAGSIGDGGLIQRGGDLYFDDVGVVTFGSREESSGSLLLTEMGSLRVDSTLRFGFRGHADVQINEGSSLIADRLIIGGPGTGPNRPTSATANIDIAGEGTLVQVFNTVSTSGSSLFVGGGGSAQVTIRDGAIVETSSANLYTTTIEGSSLVIDGQQSALKIIRGRMLIGRERILPDDYEVGNFTLTLRNDGTLDTEEAIEPISIERDARINGSGTIMGDAWLYERATIDAGESNSFGYLTFTDQLDTSFGGTLHFDIGSINDFDQLTVHDLIAGGTLEVAIADEFIAEFGQSFDIISADTFTGDFDMIELPELDGALFFEANVHAQGVTLSVVPAPASLLALALPMLARARRRT